MDRIYPVQGMASCPPSKNVPTAVDTIADLKRHRLFDKSGNHATSLFSVHIHTWIIHTFASSAPLREPINS